MLSTESATSQLQRDLEHHIHQRTYGQVHHLRVEVRENGVLISGQTNSYYIRQLVTAAVLERLQARPVDLDIQVEPWLFR